MTLREEVNYFVSEIPDESLEKVLMILKNFLKSEKKSAFGILSKYADKNLIEQEKSAWESEVAKNYEKNFT